MPGKRLRIFLSCDAANREMAELVSSLLEAHGIRVSMAAADLRPGKNWSEFLRDAIRDCDAVVVLLTANALNSDNTAYEVGMALALSKPIHVLFDGITREQIPDYLLPYPVSGVSRIAAVAQELRNLGQTTASK